MADAARAAPSPHGGGCVTAFGGVVPDAGTTMGGPSELGSNRSGGGADPSRSSVDRPFEAVPGCGATPARVLVSVSRARPAGRGSPRNMSPDSGGVLIPAPGARGESAPATAGGLSDRTRSASAGLTAGTLSAVGRSSASRAGNWCVSAASLGGGSGVRAAAPTTVLPAGGLPSARGSDLSFSSLTT